MADLVVRVTGEVVTRESDGKPIVLVETYHGGRLLSQQVIESPDDDDDDSPGDFVDGIVSEIAAHEDSILAAAMNGETLCPSCKGKGCEGLGLMEADWPCRTCSGRGIL